jgi:hypothetical protein
MQQALLGVAVSLGMTPLVLKEILGIDPVQYVEKHVFQKIVDAKRMIEEQNRKNDYERKNAIDKLSQEVHDKQIAEEIAQLSQDIRDKVMASSPKMEGAKMEGGVTRGKASTNKPIKGSKGFQFGKSGETITATMTSVTRGKKPEEKSKEKYQENLQKVSDYVKQIEDLTKETNVKQDVKISGSNWDKFLEDMKSIEKQQPEIEEVDHAENVYKEPELLQGLSKWNKMMEDLETLPQTLPQKKPEELMEVEEIDHDENVYKEPEFVFPIFQSHEKSKWDTFMSDMHKKIPLRKISEPKQVESSVPIKLVNAIDKLTEDIGGITKTGFIVVPSVTVPPIIATKIISNTLHDLVEKGENREKKVEIGDTMKPFQFHEYANKFLATAVDKSVNAALYKLANYKDIKSAADFVAILKEASKMDGVPSEFKSKFEDPDTALDLYKKYNGVVVDGLVVPPRWSTVSGKHDYSKLVNEPKMVPGQTPAPEKDIRAGQAKAPPNVEHMQEVKEQEQRELEKRRTPFTASERPQTEKDYEYLKAAIPKLIASGKKELAVQKLKEFVNHGINLGKKDDKAFQDYAQDIMKQLIKLDSKAKEKVEQIQEESKAHVESIDNAARREKLYQDFKDEERILLSPASSATSDDIYRIALTNYQKLGKELGLKDKPLEEFNANVNQFRYNVRDRATHGPLNEDTKATQLVDAEHYLNPELAKKSYHQYLNSLAPHEQVNKMRELTDIAATQEISIEQAYDQLAQRPNLAYKVPTLYSGKPQTYLVPRSKGGATYIKSANTLEGVDTQLTADQLADMNNTGTHAVDVPGANILGTVYEVPPATTTLDINTLPVQGDQAFPGHQGLTPATITQPAGILPVNSHVEPVQSTAGVLADVGSNLLFDGGAAFVAGALASSNLYGVGPFASYAFSSIYNNFLRDLTRQNQLYRPTAEAISQKIQGATVQGLEKWQQLGLGDKASKKKRRADFISGISDPGQNPESSSERMVRARNEPNDMGFEVQRMNPMSSISDLQPISAEVENAFAARRSTDLVGQSQQEYQTWVGHSGPFAVR